MEGNIHEVEAHHPQHEVQLHIFVNRRKFDEHITREMTVDAIAKLVGMTAATATVRRQLGEKVGPPLEGVLEIHNGDHFVVTRKHVEGGYEPAERIVGELDRLRAGGQVATVITAPAAVIFHGLPVLPGAPVATTDVLVPIPPGYPASMLDLAYLPEGSPLIGRVKGVPQTSIHADGRAWRQISYHPHNGGGGPPWNPNLHGFHTYIDELLTWLGGLK